MSHGSSPGAQGRLQRMGLIGLVAALTLCLMPGLAEAAKGKKKKKKPDVTVMSRNLYLGTGLRPALAQGLALGTAAGRPDAYADAVGRELRNVDINDFNTRAISLAREIKVKRPDLVGLQEAALWRRQAPTDATPLNPNSTLASTPAYDFIERLLLELNRKAKTKKQCAKAAKKKKGKKGSASASAKKKRKKGGCYRGYRLVTQAEELDFESFADKDNSLGPDGKTFDLADSASLGAAAPSRWLEGNDDPEVSFGEPPAAQCSDGVDNDGILGADWGADPKCTSKVDNVENRPAQCSDGADNDGDGLTDAAGGDPECDPAPGAPAPTAAFDDSEATNGFQSKPSALPPDTNFDSHAFSSSPNPGPGGFDIFGNGTDPAGSTDCSDNRAAAGPALGAGGGAWMFSGYNGDQDPATPGSQVNVCLFHGIDLDGRLTMRDAIIARKGAGVKTSNPTGGNFSTILQFSFAGQPLRVKRGFNAIDANVRGHRFHFVNAHLEAFDDGAANPTSNIGVVGRGKVREAQAQQLLAGPLQSSMPVVLVGDLNSNVPGVQAGDELAFQALLNGGFQSRVSPPPPWSCCYGELLTNPVKGFDHVVDHVMTNSSAIRLRRSFVTSIFGNGLWSSDHGGVVSQLDFPGKGKKKKKKKK